MTIQFTSILKGAVALSIITIYAAQSSAQIPASSIPAPMASYSGQMQITDSGDTEVTMQVFAKPGARRMETPSDDGIIITIIDSAAREAFTFGKDANGPMGKQALKMHFGPSVEAMAADMSSIESPKLLGTEIVGGRACSNYGTPDGTVCVTGDGILLQAMSNSGTRMEMVSLERGQQAAYLFRVPNGYILNDMSAHAELPMPAAQSVQEGEAGNVDFQAFIENQAHKQTKKQIKRMARDQIGSSIGGALGGGLVGSTIGNEVGNVAKGFVGGLFGKKKKKKEEAPEEVSSGKKAE